MSDFIVLSHSHSLLPFAWLLREEGHNVLTVVDNLWYERTWEGRLEKMWAGKTKGDEEEEVWGATVLGARRANAPVLTDSRRWSARFEGYDRLYGVVKGEGHLRAQMLGFWWDGSSATLTHLLLEDQGLWPGGLGPRYVAGATVLAGGWPDSWWEALAPVFESLSRAGYRGWVRAQLSLAEDPQEVKEVGGWRAGWFPGQAHAAVANLKPGLSPLLMGQPAEFQYRHSVALMVSQPPFPTRSRDRSARGGIPLPEPTQGPGARILWHDVTWDGEEGARTAGTDGLTAWVVGSAHSLWLARQRALHAAGVVSKALPEAQVRTDVAASVDQIEGVLEQKGLVFRG